MSNPTLYPEAIPRHVLADPFRSAEVRVFEQLKEQLDAEFTVFYSRPWLGLKPTGEEIDGEADFVIVHKVFGLLSIEVKGGCISYDPKKEIWYSRDRNNFTNEIKDPVNQARRCKYQLIEKFNVASEDKRYIRIRHGVIFPDSVVPNDTGGADRPRSLFCDEVEFANLGDYIRRRMGFDQPLCGTEEELTEHGVATFEKILAGAFQLRVPAAVDVRLEEHQIEYLTTEQFALLDFLSNQTRCAVAGPAGTGKTILAREKAVRAAASGERTLLLCFNRPLAKFLTATSGSVPNLRISTFHDFVSFAVKRSGTEFPAQPTREELGRLLQRSASSVAGGFDVIVIDEAQDFHASWWEALELIVGSTKQFYVFYDNQQQLYATETSYTRMMPQAPYPLMQNIRNSKPIFQVARPWFGKAPVRASGPDGVAVQWQTNDGSPLEKQIAKLINNLVAAERISPHKISVLLPDEDQAEKIRSSKELHAFVPVSADEIPQRNLIVSGIRRFKGLDAAVVVLVITGSALPDPELLYVGLTRARSLLCVLATAAVCRKLRPEAQQAAAR